jgi:galactofuranosyltransferase-like protein
MDERDDFVTTIKGVLAGGCGGGGHGGGGDPVGGGRGAARLVAALDERAVVDTAPSAPRQGPVTIQLSPNWSSGVALPRRAHAAPPDAHGVLGGRVLEMALADFLGGPEAEALFLKLPTGLGEIRAKRAECTTAARLTRRRRDALAPQGFAEPPTEPVSIRKGLVTSVLHNLRAPDPAHHVIPQRNVPAGTVVRPVGAGPGHRVDARGSRRHVPPLRPGFKQMVTSARQLRAVGKVWPTLRERYRAALPELTSPEAWVREVFDRD